MVPTCTCSTDRLRAHPLDHCETRLSTPSPAPRTRAAIVLSRTDAGATTPTATVYVTGPARRLYATVIARALLDEGAGHVEEAHVRVSEQGPRTTRRE